MAKKKIRRFRDAKLKILKFLCVNFRRHIPFKWEDVVAKGWTGPRWDLAKLFGEHYLRHSLKVMGAYTYARGASNGAKYGKVVRRRSRKVVRQPSVAGSQRPVNLSSYESDLMEGIQEVDKKIEELTAIREELNNAYMAVEALPKVSELLAKLRKAMRED